MPSSKASARQASRELRSASPTKQMPTLNDEDAAAAAIAARPKAVPKSRKRKDGTSGHRKGASTTSTPPIAELDTPLDDVDELAEAVVADAIGEQQVDVEAVADALVGPAQPVTAEALAAVEAAQDDIEEDALPAGNARVTVTSDVQTDPVDGTETTHTSVKIQMPFDAPAQGVPSSPEATLKAARKIVEEAVELQSEQASAISGASNATEKTAKKSRSKKRKAEEPVVDDKVPEKLSAPEEVVIVSEPAEKPAVNGVTEEPVAKRARVMVPADEYRRERMQKRAIIGLSATLAVGAMIPFVSNLF